MNESEEASAKSSPTAARILDVAQELLQQRGYNAVSYGDLAAELDLTTAAIHYHFPSKADLGRAVVARYRRANGEERAAIRERTDSVRARLTQYVDLYADILREGGLCLCGVLAADEATLPAEVQREVQGFFEDQKDWLTPILAEGTEVTTKLDGCESARQAADLFLAAIEGAMLTHRGPRKGPNAYRASLRCFIDTVASGGE